MPPEPLSASDQVALDNLREVVAGGVLSGYRVSQPEGGKFCQRVEAELAHRLGFRHALLCNSATTGLYLALRACGVGPHDRVLVPAYTMAGTAAAVLMTGATPILVDVDPLSGLVVPNTIHEALGNYTDAIPPTALIAVDIHGGIIPTTVIRRHFPNLKIISDCAQAFDHREEFSGLPAGSTSDCAVFSFKQGKQLSCGEGGVVCTNDTALAQRISLARNHGDVRDDTTFGGNFHLTELEAAVLDAKLNYQFADPYKTQAYSRMLIDGINASNACYTPMPLNGPPFIFWILAAGHTVPAGFTRGYHKPLCCLPYYKRELKQGCLLGAHVYSHNMSWAKPPQSREGVDRMLESILAASDNCNG